jgi:hypothetical protein
MLSIENILDNYTQIHLSLFDNYSNFGYPSKETLYVDLDFLVNNIYHTTLIDSNNIRLSQEEFRKELLNKYNKCIISDNDCYHELEACHIVEVHNGGDYLINNGIILQANLHNTFDKYLWCINPYTKLIEVKDNHLGSINQYIHKYIDIDDSIIDNLIIRYNEYLIKN